jgi:hypothetical protein
MSMLSGRSAAEWATTIAGAYAAQACPPLTPELVEQVRDIIAEVVAEAQVAALPEAELCERINLTLDRTEMSLHAVVGPRVAALDNSAGTVRMMHRSEAARPLRAFGGQ